MTNLVLLPEAERPAFNFNSPFSTQPCGASWLGWADYHMALGQELAKRMRGYGGPATQEDPPEGGTPAAVAMRKAA